MSIASHVRFDHHDLQETRHRKHGPQDNAMKPTNVLFILSDEHQHNLMGCAGHPFIKTPSLDALAQRGTRFSNAYTPSPICVPARASLATGRYVHDIRCWDNAIAYDGSSPGWA